MPSIRQEYTNWTSLFIQANVRLIVFVNFDSRYGEYLQEYANYFGGPLILKNLMYGMTNTRDLFADELINWLIDESGSNQ